MFWCATNSFCCENTAAFQKDPSYTCGADDAARFKEQWEKIVEQKREWAAEQGLTASELTGALSYLNIPSDVFRTFGRERGVASLEVAA